MKSFKLELKYRDLSWFQWHRYSNNATPSIIICLNTPKVVFPFDPNNFFSPRICSTYTIISFMWFKMILTITSQTKPRTYPTECLFSYRTYGFHSHVPHISDSYSIFVGNLFHAYNNQRKLIFSRAAFYCISMQKINRWHIMPVLHLVETSFRCVKIQGKKWSYIGFYYRFVATRKRYTLHIHIHMVSPYSNI